MKDTIGGMRSVLELKLSEKTSTLLQKNSVMYKFANIRLIYR